MVGGFATGLALTQANDTAGSEIDGGIEIHGRGARAGG
jgi:hypothetical protein